MKPIKIRKELDKLSRYGTIHNEKTISKLVPTALEFYPNYENSKVRISLSILNNLEYRVSIWGADDLGYEFDMQNLQEAIKVYNSLNYIDHIPEGFKRG